VLQALDHWRVADHPMSEVEAQFRAVNKMDKVDELYFSQLIRGVETHCEQIDSEFVPFLDRQLAELNPVELCILRLSGYELLFCPETPYRIILEEAVLLAKAFGAQDGFRYVNGVLNQVARKVRTTEIQQETHG
jgi:N utilization substance protein B